jgi:probable F420-dependent oxidoreductase
MMKLGVIPLCERDVTTDPRWVAAFMQLLEDEGEESVWMPEHVIMALDYEPLYEYTDDGRAPIGATTMMPDPLHWLTFAAAHSERVRLGTGVLIGPQHSAAILAKRLATIDALAGGRLEVGIGIGWQKEEYQAVGVPYHRRGARLDETIDAMRALWRDTPASFHGEFIDFERVVCDTKPAQRDGVPLLIGGSSEAAARRAGQRGDGFFPYTIAPEATAQKMQLARASAREAGRDPQALSLTVWPHSYRAGGTFDLALARSYAAAGADRLIVAAFEAGDAALPAIRNLLRRYQDEIIAKL